jgi:hypothetical protein
MARITGEWEERTPIMEEVDKRQEERLAQMREASSFGEPARGALATTQAATTTLWDLAAVTGKRVKDEFVELLGKTTQIGLLALDMMDVPIEETIGKLLTNNRARNEIVARYPATPERERALENLSLMAYSPFPNQLEGARRMLAGHDVRSVLYGDHSVTDFLRPQAIALERRLSITSGQRPLPSMRTLHPALSSRGCCVTGYRAQHTKGLNSLDECCLISRLLPGGLGVVND